MTKQKNIYTDSACNYVLHALNTLGGLMNRQRAILKRTTICVSWLFLLLVVCSSVASATDYYMSPTGNNDNTGTSLDTTWTTLSRAQEQLAAGDTLYIVDGTYYDDSFVAQVSGTAANPITIQAYNGTPTFIETDGVGRNLDLFVFHDWGCPGPISHYNIDGIRAENYSTTFAVWRNSNHISITNITTDNCRYLIHALRGCSYVTLRDCVAYDSWYAPYHFWYDNHHFTLENITAENIYDHGFIDLHTNNDNFIIRDATFRGEIYDGELIYMHGDYGTNDNNSFYNISLQPSIKNGQEGMDIWSMGYNNYFENLTILDIHDHAAIQIMGVGKNLTLKDVKIRSLGYHGIVLSSATDLDGILFDNISIEGVDHANYYSDFSIQSTNVKDIVIRDAIGDGNNVRIGTSYPISRHFVTEYTDNRVFAENYANADPRYYPDKSSISIEEPSGTTIRYYPLTAVPSSGSAEVAVNKFDTSLSRGETLVDVTANTMAGNEVVFTISDLTPGTNYLVKRDGVDFATKQADLPGHIEFSNSEWSSAHRFTVVESDTIDPLVTNLRNDQPAQNTVTLRWDCSAPDMNHYTIHKDGALLDTTGNKYYSATNLLPDTTYTFEVSATNKGGITGDSVSITVRTAAEESFGSNTLYIADDVTVSRGSYVTVPIMIYDATGIACDGVNLTYDASVVNVVGVTQGDFTTYFGFDDGSAADGWVTVNTYVSGTSLTGDAKIADVTLKAVGDAGDTSPLDMEIMAMTDQNGHPVSGTVSNGLFTVVSDTSPPVVTHSSASQLIPDDTDGVPSWGETATLNVTVTDESDIAGVTIDLSAIGGSPVQPMTHIGNNVWSVTTSASAGTPPQTYDLTVCATDIHGYTNMQESVELVVMRNGDVTGDNDVTLDDVALLENYVTYPGRYTISSEFVADVTGDGVINIADAMMLANHVANPDRPIRYVENTC